MFWHRIDEHGKSSVRLCSGRFAATPAPLAFPAAFSIASLSVALVYLDPSNKVLPLASHPCFGGESEKGRRGGNSSRSD